MAKVKSRVFLFQGNDALASRRSLQKWESLFIEKHSDMSHHRIYLDEMAFADAKIRIEQALTEQSLFQSAILCVIYRPTSQEKGRTGVFSQVLLDLITPLLKGDASDVTVLIWEGKRLADNHILRQWFTDHETRGLARAYEFTVPPHRELLSEAQAYVTDQGYLMTQSATRLLDSALVTFEKEQRSSERLKARDLPVHDMRRWWLWNVLDTVMLATKDTLIKEDVLQTCLGEVHAVITPFEIANACDNRQWKQASKLLSNWENKGDEGQYFMLMAILRQRFAMRVPHTEAQYAMRLLAEMELLSKNGILPISSLFTLFFIRLEQAQFQEALIPPKVAWLGVQ